jgi:hypothetical protein
MASARMLELGVAGAHLVEKEHVKGEWLQERV